MLKIGQQISVAVNVVGETQIPAPNTQAGSRVVYLALTDRVSRQGHASLEDYRQAFMLYLLYHRGHLGE